MKTPLQKDGEYKVNYENIINKPDISNFHALHADDQNLGDITKEQIEAKLIGEISSHTHAGGGGGGDMYKGTYDTDNDGKVDNAENVSDGTNTSTATEVKDAVDEKHSNTLDHSNSFDHSNSLDHSNANDPTTDQKSALAGTNGTPSGTNKFVTNTDPRNTDARTPSSHSHPPSEVTGTAVITNDSRLSDARTPTAHNQDASTINAGTLDGDRLPAFSTTKKAGVPATGTPSGKYLKDDGTWATPSGGSDPWTYTKVTSQFSTSSTAAVNVTELAFAPLLNTNYEFEAILMIRTATAIVNPRVGLAWPTGMTDGVALINESQTATTQLLAFGNINTALLIAVGGLVNQTQSWPVLVKGMVVAGASPSGNVKIQLASETTGTNVYIQAGSFLKYRSYA